MKILNGHLEGYLEALKPMTYPAFEIPIAGAINVRDLIISLESRLKVVHDVRQSLFDRYGEKDENGKVRSIDLGGGKLQMVLKEEHLAQFQAEYDDLMNAESDVAPFLTPADLPARVSPGLLLKLGPLFVANPGPKAVA